MMKNSYVFVAPLLLLVAFEVTASPAHARGGGPPQMNWPGYQQRLQESRGYVTNRSVSQPYTKPPAAYPGKTWKKKRKHS